MAYGILAEDMLAICLLFAGGDVMTPMGEVICHAEEFQRGRRYFGASDLDFRWAFMHLAEGASKGKKTRQEVWCQGDVPRIIFSGLLLRDFIEPVLRKSGIWFNDEGEHWESEDEYPPSPRNLKMRRFFFPTGEPDAGEGYRIPV
ncbi:MAG TPA: hypothetical protein VMW63_02425 [Methanoregulaceae archaeon]|nr:hypothetical protein [Methanoregulaceae archaeon]